MGRRVLAWSATGWVDPAALFMTLFGGDEAAFWLDCGPDAVSGISAMGAAGRTVVEGVDGRVLDEIADDLASIEPPMEEGEGFRLGWVACFGYGLREQTMGEHAIFRSRHPDAIALRVDRA